MIDIEKFKPCLYCGERGFKVTEFTEDDKCITCEKGCDFSGWQVSPEAWNARWHKTSEGLPSENGTYLFKTGEEAIICHEVNYISRFMLLKNYVPDHYVWWAYLPKGE